MTTNSTEFAKDANVFEVATSRVPAEKLKAVTPIHTATSSSTNLFSTSGPIAQSDLIVRRREAAVKTSIYDGGT